MSALNFKDIKKLAAMCKKAGITSFKCYKDGSYEFSLDPTQPVVKRVSKNQPIVTSGANFIPEIGENILTEEQLLFWSSDSINNPKEAENA